MGQYCIILRQKYVTFNALERHLASGLINTSPDFLTSTNIAGRHFKTHILLITTIVVVNYALLVDQITVSGNKMCVKTSIFANITALINQVFFRHLKVWVTVAKHKFKWMELKKKLRWDYNYNIILGEKSSTCLYNYSQLEWMNWILGHRSVHIGLLEMARWIKSYCHSDIGFDIRALWPETKYATSRSRRLPTILNL